MDILNKLPGIFTTWIKLPQKPSHFPFSLKCQRENTRAGCSAFRCFRALSVFFAAGPPLCNHCLGPADRGFLLDGMPALGLVPLTLKLRCLLRPCITAPGLTQLPALPQQLHSWEVSEFPRRWSTSNICSSLSHFGKPSVLFCYPGFQEWVWGLRIRREGSYHCLSNLGAMCPSCPIWTKSSYCIFEIGWPCWSQTEIDMKGLKGISMLKAHAN